MSGPLKNALQLIGFLGFSVFLQSLGCSQIKMVSRAAKAKHKKKNVLLALSRRDLIRETDLL